MVSFNKVGGGYMVYKDFEEAAKYIEDAIKGANKPMPKVGMIMGSGLGVIGDYINDPLYIDYEKIPNFPTSTVKGHEGRFVIGEYCGKDIILMQGRFHFYEGYSAQLITFPVRVLKLLGVDRLIITNAAGGVNPDFTEGALMLINDHINIMGNNPLIGANEPKFGPRFPDVSDIYNKSINIKIKEKANSAGIDLKEGVYFYFTGPSYETPAEIRLTRALGGDAVGMSTAPEAIVAAHMGMVVTGISCITNMAAGMTSGPLLHTEVVEVANRVRQEFIKIIKIVLEETC